MAHPTRFERVTVAFSGRAELRLRSGPR